MEAQSLLALQGAHPVRTQPFAPWPYFDDELVDRVSDVLRSGKVNYWSGEEGREFEKEFAATVGSKHAVAVANGTLALELALAGLGIGPGDEVLVPSRTFIASASAVVMRGAIPVIVDIDPVSQNLNVESIEKARTSRTKAVIAVHLAGWPCDMKSVMAFAEEKGIYVIEDCAQAHGATLDGQHVGGFGHVGCFSFCQDKILSTGGEGGMMVTNDQELWNRCWSYKDHGKNWDAVYNRAHATVFKFLHEDFGTNWRLTEMQSAIGRVILQRLPEWVAIRRANAVALSRGLSRLPGIRIESPSDRFGHSYYKFYAFIEPEELSQGWTRDEIVRAIQAEGIPCGSGACGEIYLERAFAKNNLGPNSPLPVARQLGDTSLMFLVHPTLNEADMQQTCEAVARVMSYARKHPLIPGTKAA